MRRVLVFCGSSPGRLPVYVEHSRALGAELAARGLGLVYGGAQVGVMGAVADAALAAGGEVVGVIPRMLVDREVAHRGLSDLRVVETMHERKALMESLSDAVIALPGGFGTLEELFEIVTWAQLGIHAKPVGLLNIAGYWDQLLAFIDHMVAERFLRAEQRAALLIAASPDELLERLASYQPVVLDKWLDRSQS
ncbi:MAG TPA: TIGR00730 family Rossman fold protein [Solirubrobacteraceae bacterium]|nr:TIGR00730 family Rossman fold protein [Solirubrobacteraceae bacterium]